MKAFTKAQTIDDNKRRIIKFIKQNGFITNRQCRELLDLKYDQVTQIFNKMINEHELIREGKTASIKYRLPV